MKKLLPRALVLGVLGQFAVSCGETVNYDTEEKLANPASVGSDNQNGDGTGAGGDAVGENGGSGSGDGINVPVACLNQTPKTKDALLVFPEIPAGTTCAFGSGDNLSKVQGVFRAYLTQTQVVDLPDGAVLCGFDLKHEAESMRYDDEMFFTVNDKLLLSTKDYSEYFASDGFFHEFSWDDLRDKPYDAVEDRAVYCAGGSSCKVPATETSGSIELGFNRELNQNLANALQSQKSLRFDWTTTGDNDNSDCRHSPINLQLSIQYVVP